MLKLNHLAVISLLIISGMALIAGCTEDEDGDDGVSLMVGGENISIETIFENDQISIDGTNGKTYEGVSLSLIVNLSSITDPENFQFKITAEDGWYQTVTWNDMMEGVLVKEETMTAFPGLPGKYRIRDVVSIEAVEAPVITVNGHLFVWQQLFHIIEDTVTLTDNESNEYEGIHISQVINITGLEDQDSHDYKIISSDDYFKDVTWEDLTKGILVLEDEMSFFPHLTKSYKIKDIIEIKVE